MGRIKKSGSDIGPIAPIEKVRATSWLTSYKTEWDHLVAGRSKTKHAVGSMCEINLNIDDNSVYTGI